MLCFRLSTTLLQAATCLLIGSGFSRAQMSGGYDEPTTKRVITCEGPYNIHRLNCETGVIIVQTALYGRADRDTCSEGRPAHSLTNTECFQHGTLEVLKKRCDGKKVCELNLNVIQTSDPCFGIYKYLDTTFACFPANARTQIQQ
ncbi:L-rhamnose-binding lectin CSL2-like [Lates japonicus]